MANKQNNFVYMAPHPFFVDLKTPFSVNYNK